MHKEEERIGKMKPINATILRELEEEIEKEKKDEKERRFYSWFEDTININFWDYRNKNPNIMRWFEISEDNAEWDILAADLGLLNQEIQHCSNFHRGFPTKDVFNMLEDKKEQKDLSLRKVLDCLVKLNHHDVLRAVPWQEGIEKFKNEFNNSKDMYKEGCKPCNLVHSNYASAQLSQTVHQGQESLVTSSSEGVVDDNKHSSMTSVKDCLGKTPLTQLDAKIMLVCAHDARVEALKVTNQLRNPQTTRGRVGVLLLDENTANRIAQELRNDPCNSIHKWFKQVDFVVPVLSPQFLRQIQNRDWESNDVNEKRYNRFVYRLTLDHYVDKGSRNIKCRPLCPSVYYNEVMRSELVKGNGLLQVPWNCSAENSVEEFANILISEAQVKRKKKRMN